MSKRQRSARDKEESRKESIKPPEVPQSLKIKTTSKKSSVKDLKAPLKKKKEDIEELLPKTILGIKRNEDRWEYAVEFTSKDNKEHSSIITCSSDYLANNCPTLLVNYLEQHIITHVKSNAN